MRDVIVFRAAPGVDPESIDPLHGLVADVSIVTSGSGRPGLGSTVPVAGGFVATVTDELINTDLGVAQVYEVHRPEAAPGLS